MSDQPITVIACGSSWGIGVYRYGDAEDEIIYGFPPTGMNPHDFSPDMESCTEREVAAWEAAKVAWGASHGKASQLGESTTES